MEFLLLLAIAGAVWAWLQKLRAEKGASLKARDASRLAMRVAAIENERDDLLRRINGLEKYQAIADAEKEAEAIVAQAKAEVSNAKSASSEATKAAAAQCAARLKESQKMVDDARAQAGLIVASARKKAEEIEGEAHDAIKRAKDYAATAEAIKGVIKGYGDAYIVPTYSLLDDLAAEFGHVDAGERLKRAREVTRAMVQANRAAVCDYAEVSRRDAAVRFVVDAFNGKVDSVLSRVKAENHGKLEQEIRGAFALVNHNGMAFRNARIVEEYLDARLEELQWAATAQALRDKERDEQRQIREQMRDEERARREYERAMKDAAQEEDAIKKAIERVQAQAAKASEDQRAAFDAKLLELQGKLDAAEEKGKRALSMAQQTKVGHVYVISNVGSFGESVFKIGMTRRLDPLDRVRELGDASVPFEFDVHAMIYSDDAPALERSMHLHFMRAQVNKVNPRKEFFRIGLNEIRAHIDARGIDAHWTAVAKANDYRETLRIEQQMKFSPEIESEWAKRQVQAEMSNFSELESEEV